MEGQICKHLNIYATSPIFQSGFSPFNGCGAALLKITDDIYCAADKGKLTAVVFLDFSKVFVTINHNTPQSILKHIGLDHTAMSLISSYFENTSQCVLLVQGNMSIFIFLRRGVPQCSILGSKLLYIYTSSLLRSFYHLYADNM